MKIERIIGILIVGGILVMGTVQYFHAQQPYSAPTTAANPFYVAYGRVDTAFFNRANTISPTVATTLTRAQSGTAVLLTIGSGITMTLPVPVTGLYYDFIWTTSTTAGGMKVITDAATTFVAGAPAIASTTTTGTVSAYVCNGTSHVATSSNGTTSGGAIGSWLRFIALSPTLWGVEGKLVGSGTFVSPCSTS